MSANKSMLIIQDDIYAGSLHLDEVLLSAIPEAVGGAAAFAFVSRDGLNAIFNSDEFTDFCRAGHHFELIIGIDSITNEHTLEFAKKLSRDLSGRLIVKVYYDDTTPDIFHAKTSWFRNSNGEGCVAFVRSGNLTLRGLQKNVEMFSWIEQDKEGFSETERTWNGWVEAARLAGRLHDVDDPMVVEKARTNYWGRRRSRRSSAQGQERAITGQNTVSIENAVVVSTIPKQTGRGWSQFAMKKEYYTDYFGFEIDESGENPVATGNRRVLLRSVSEDGAIGLAESRRGNISSSSRNYRIELGAARNAEVPDDTNPIVVFIKTDERSYLYEIFDNSSVKTAEWLNQLVDFATRNAGARRPTEKPKCWTTLNMLSTALPDLPILKARANLVDPE